MWRYECSMHNTYNGVAILFLWSPYLITPNWHDYAVWDSTGAIETQQKNKDIHEPILHKLPNAQREREHDYRQGVWSMITPSQMIGYLHYSLSKPLPTQPNYTPDHCRNQSSLLAPQTCTLLIVTFPSD